MTGVPFDKLHRGQEQRRQDEATKAAERRVPHELLQRADAVLAKLKADGGQIGPGLRAEAESIASELRQYRDGERFMAVMKAQSGTQVRNYAEFGKFFQ